MVNSIFKDLAKVTTTSWYVLSAIIILSLIILIVKPKTKVNVKAIVYGGLLISIAFVLSYIKFYRWPQGGSITLASMLPMLAYAYIFGPRAGILAGAAYGLLQIIQDPYIVHPAQVILDYFVAFAALGLAGFIPGNLGLAVLLGGFGRFFASFLSGVIFFGSYAPEGMNPLIYSLAVNGTVIGTDTLLCLLVALIPQVKTVILQMKAKIY